MSRAKKDYVVLNINLDKRVNEILIKYCEQSGLTKTKAVEKAVESFIEGQKKIK